MNTLPITPDEVKAWPPVDAIAKVAGWLSHLIDPDQVVEIRALEVQGVEPSKYSGKQPAYAGHFYGNELNEIARAALEISGHCKGVYYTLNPLDPKRIPRQNPRVQRANRSHQAADEWVLSRQRLVIDIDRTKTPADRYLSATNDERARVFELLRRVKDHLSNEGFPAPVMIDSGNGYQLIYRIPELPFSLPLSEDDPIRLFLRHLAEKFDGPDGTIDTSVFNPGRIVRFPGTLNCKGPNSPDRPHRRARLIEAPDQLLPVPLELLTSLAGRAQPKQRVVIANWTRRAACETQRELAPSTHLSTDDRIRRARAYLRKVPGAISGMGGHNQTFRVACKLIIGFGLMPAEALPLLVEWNATCDPPWEVHEIERKLAEADKQPGERGRLLSSHSDINTENFSCDNAAWEILKIGLERTDRVEQLLVSESHGTSRKPIDLDALAAELGGEPYKLEPDVSPFACSTSESVRVARIVIKDTPNSDTDTLRKIIGPSPPVKSCPLPIRRVAEGVSIATCGCDRLFTLGCGRWSCDVCKVRKQYKIKLENAPRVFCNVTHVWRGTSLAWEATRKKLKRADFESTVYSLVQAGGLVLFVAVHHSPDDVPEAIGLKRVNGTEAAQLFCQSVDAVPTDGPSKRFRAGHGWKDLPSVDLGDLKPKPIEKTNWKFLDGIVKGTYRTVEKVLESYHTDYKVETMVDIRHGGSIEHTVTWMPSPLDRTKILSEILLPSRRKLGSDEKWRYREIDRECEVMQRWYMSLPRDQRPHGLLRELFESITNLGSSPAYPPDSGGSSTQPKNEWIDPIPW